MYGTEEKEAESGGILEQLNNPPPFTLPEEIRHSIRLFLEELDLEWMVRHPSCDRLENAFFDAEHKWGEKCRACFSPVTWEELIGDIERALALHRAFATAPVPSREELLGRLREQTDLTERLATALDRAATEMWPFVFHRRAELATERLALTELQRCFAAAAAALQELPRQPSGPAGETAPGSERELRLAWLLAGILREGGLPCFVETLPEGELRSPGMEILVACLEQVDIRLSPRVLHRLLFRKRQEGTGEESAVSAGRISR